MKKKIFLAIVGLITLTGALAGVKVLQIGRMIEGGKHFVPPPEAITTAVVRKESWESLLSSVGSLVAVQGVTVTAELDGKIAEIAFEPGSTAKAGDVLVRQDTSSEEAQLRAAEAQVALTSINFERSKQLVATKSISQSEFDAASAQYKSAVAAADNVRATIHKKSVRAPFAGRLGIRLVNLGQLIRAGDPVVSLQTLDPIFVNFLLPQQDLAKIQVGMTTRVTTDAFPDEAIEGKITAINPQVDAATRNVEVQATVSNPQERLRPGMFVDVAVVLPARNNVVAIPATAVLYAPYSDSVFLMEEKKGEKGGAPELIARQQFVQLGESRGDFVSVVSGLKGGETVASTGAFKLRNGQAVSVDNTLAPEFKQKPSPEDT